MSFLPEFWGWGGRGTWEPWVTPLGFSLVGVPRPAGWGDPGNCLDQGDLQRGPGREAWESDSGLPAPKCRAINSAPKEFSKNPFL